MADEAENPYRAPQAEVVPERPLMDQGVITDTMVLYLRKAYPWIRFLGVLGFIIFGLSVLSGLGFAVFGIIQLPRTQVSVGSFGTIAYGLILIASSVVSFLPARFTYQYGSKLKCYCQTFMESDLEEALKNNKSLWTFFGVVAIIYLSLIPLLIIAGLIIAAIAAQSGGFLNL
ncbi:hypothetical protein ACYULU_15765 [Breznakiellaceae bacterium SP9]